MGKKIKVVHFRDNCIGCNNCVIQCPGSWSIDPNDGKANLKDAENKNGVFVSEITEAEVEANLLAERDCPMAIIKVENVPEN